MDREVIKKFALKWMVQDVDPQKSRATDRRDLGRYYQPGQYTASFAGQSTRPS
jgi:hypothetical protein